jgi:hypothetical protein
MLGLVGVAIVAFAGLVKEALVPLAEQRAEERRQTAEAHAVELLLTKDRDRTSLAVLNKSGHAIKDVRIDCHPIGRYGQFPQAEPAFEPTARRLEYQIEYAPIFPLGQSITVKRMLPADHADQATGPTLGSYEVSDEAPTRMAFEVAWLDNADERHSLVGEVNLRDIELITIVELEPPSSPITQPTWWWRLKSRLRATPAGARRH